MLHDMVDPIDVTVHRTEDLDAGQRRRISDVCNHANDTEEFDDLFRIYIPSGGRHIVGTIDGVVVSHAVVTTRWVQPAGCEPLRTAFVDAVATDPAAQHRGAATTVIARLNQVIDDYEIGCLQTDIPGFYARIGWERWRGPLAGRRDAELVPTPDQHGVMVLPLPSGPPLDLDQLLSIEAQPNRFWG